MPRQATWVLSGVLLLSLAACDAARWQPETGTRSSAETIEAVTLEKNGIHLTPLPDSLARPEAQLTVLAPGPDAVAADGRVAFSYALTGVAPPRLAAGASAAAAPHIRTILDNRTPTSHTTPAFRVPLNAGPHVMLSFLEGADGVSLKHPGAADLRRITVAGEPGENTGVPFDAQAPQLFHSRPAGVYKGKEAERVLLDFYLVNTTLSEQGNKVRATVNGTEFLLSRWVPYLIEGLAPGENTLKLELLNERGDQIPGPFNAETFTFTLQP